MNDRRHVWHDPSYPPHEVITEDRSVSLPRSVKSSKRARTTVWVLLWLLVGGAVLTVALVFGAALIAGVVEGLKEPMMSSSVTASEEEGVRGLAATVADRGRRADFEAIVELGDGSEHLDAAEFAADVSAAFSDFPIKDWGVDLDNVQVLVDQKTQERIVVFRLVLTGTSGERRVTNPFYAVDSDGEWRLTGIAGRDVKEDLF